LGVNLNNESIYTQLSICDCVEVFKLLDNYDFNLLKKDDMGNLLLNVFTIRSEEVLGYFMEKKYTELYEQIFYNAVLNNYLGILKVFFTNNLVKNEIINSIDVGLRLFLWGNFGYSKNILCNL